MAVALRNFRRLIGAGKDCLRLNLAGIRAQAHRASLGQVTLLVRHQIYHRVPGFRIELAGICVLPPHDMLGIFYDSDLHSQTNTKVRDMMRSGIGSGGNHPLYPTAAETARYNNARAVL